MLYTGHHARKYKGMERVSISAYDPRGSKVDRRLGALAPTRPMLRMPKKEYDQKMAAILEKADSEGVIEKLLADAEVQDIVLLCWERDPRECHRKQVAEFIKARYGTEVTEAGVAAPLPAQPTLL